MWYELQWAARGKGAGAISRAEPIFILKESAAEFKYFTFFGCASKLLISRAAQTGPGERGTQSACAQWAPLRLLV